MNESTSTLIPENRLDSDADRRLECANKAIVTYFSDNSEEFRKLNALREKASYFPPKLILLSRCTSC